MSASYINYAIGGVIETVQLITRKNKTGIALTWSEMCFLYAFRWECNRCKISESLKLSEVEVSEGHFEIYRIFQEELPQNIKLLPTENDVDVAVFLNYFSKHSSF